MNKEIINKMMQYFNVLTLSKEEGKYLSDKAY